MTEGVRPEEDPGGPTANTAPRPTTASILSKAITTRSLRNTISEETLLETDFASLIDV